MIATRLLRAAVAVAGIAVATVSSADDRLTIGTTPPWQIGPIRPDLRIQQVPDYPLQLCGDPTPLSIGFSTGTTHVPYHGQAPAVIVTGTVTNLGPGTFNPVAGQQEIQLWIKWGSAASHSLLATAPLTSIGVGQNVSMTGAVLLADYGTLFDLYGAPHIRLMVVSSAGDCHTGLSNQAAGYGPPLSSI